MNLNMPTLTNGGSMNYLKPKNKSDQSSTSNQGILSRHSGVDHVTKEKQDEERFFGDLMAIQESRGAPPETRNRGRSFQLT